MVFDLDHLAAKAIHIPVIAPAEPGLIAGDTHVFHDPDALGTRLSLLVRASGRDAAFAAAGAVRREIDRLAAIFDWRRGDSEIAGLNRHPEWIASPELFSVVAAAERWRRASLGALSGRMGRLLATWRNASRLPDAGKVADLAQAIAHADVGLDAASRTIIRPAPVSFDLDALAKGYIIDAALSAAIAVEGVAGALVDIGGDICCAGTGPGEGTWQVGLPDPLRPFDNAPLFGAFQLTGGAVATSGCGPRDRCVEGRMLSSTLDPRTGWPVAYMRSASVLAPCAMEADALATAMLVLSREEAEACFRPEGAIAARVTDATGADWLWREAPAQWRQKTAKPGNKSTDKQDEYQSGWEPGWTADISFTAPPKDMRRAIAFRSPYVAIWISNAERRSVRTLLLIGTIKEWQENNHVWWRLNQGATERLLNSRSMSTRGTGLYRIYWDGIDDEGRPLGPGRYTFHVETSREGGGHEHRTLEAEFVKGKPFEVELPVDPASGGLRVSFRAL